MERGKALEGVRQEADEIREEVEERERAREEHLLSRFGVLEAEVRALRLEKRKRQAALEEARAVRCRFFFRFLFFVLVALVGWALGHFGVVIIPKVQISYA